MSVCRYVCMWWVVGPYPKFDGFQHKKFCLHHAIVCVQCACAGLYGQRHRQEKAQRKGGEIMISCPFHPLLFQFVHLECRPCLCLSLFRESVPHCDALGALSLFFSNRISIYHRTDALRGGSDEAATSRSRFDDGELAISRDYYGRRGGGVR